MDLEGWIKVVPCITGFGGWAKKWSQNLHGFVGLDKSVLKTVLDLEGRVKVVLKPSWIWGVGKKMVSKHHWFSRKGKNKVIGMATVV